MVDGNVTEVTPNQGVKLLMVTAPNTTDDGDTIAIDLSSYGCNSFLGMLGWIHTTEGSVVVQEQPTVSVSGSTVTLTVGGSTDNKARVYLLLATSKLDTNVAQP